MKTFLRIALLSQQDGDGGENVRRSGHSPFHSIFSDLARSDQNCVSNKDVGYQFAALISSSDIFSAAT
jgi:hypothetical protein